MNTLEKILVGGASLFIIGTASAQDTNFNGRVENSGLGLNNKKVEIFFNQGTGQKKYVDFTDIQGNFLANNTTDIKLEDRLPEGYSISQNYPNPFGNNTKINIEIPKESKIDIKVYSVIPEELKDLRIEQELRAGTHIINLDMNNYASGIYFADIIIDNKYRQTKKMMLLKGLEAPTTQTTIKKITETTTTVDSVIISGDAIKKTTFTGFPTYTSNNIDLGTFNVDSAYVVVDGRVYKLMEWQQQNNGIEGANITIGNQTTTTGPNGTYSLIIPTGKNNVIITHPEIWTRQTKIKTENDTTIDFDILDKTNWNDTLMTFYDDVYGRARNPPYNISRKWNVKGEKQAIFYITADTTNEFEKIYANIIKNKINEKLKPLFITPKYPEGYHKDAIIEIGTNPQPWGTPQNYIAKRENSGGTSKAVTATTTNYFDSTSQYMIGEIYSALTKFRTDLDAYWLDRVALHELLTGMTDATRSDLLPSVLNIFPSEENSNGTDVDKKCILYHTQRPGGSKSPDTDDGWEGWE